MSDPSSTREEYLKVITEQQKDVNNEILLILKSAEDDQVK